MQIGDNTYGGIITYLFVFGDTGDVEGEEHGFVVSSEDIGVSIWGCTGLTYASGITIGTGYQNTLNILEKCTDMDCAARLCTNYSGGGYTDWFLPSNDEALTFVPLSWSGIGNFMTGETVESNDGKYYTSTEVDSDKFGNAWDEKYYNIKMALTQSMNYNSITWNDNTQYPYWTYFGASMKDIPLSIRAIRYF